MRSRLFVALLPLLAGSGCAAHETAVRVRDPTAVERALARAEAAYIEGDFDQSMDETTAVLDATAEPAARYQALKIRALAGCRANDAPAPPPELARQLTPADRRAISSLCALAAPGRHGYAVAY